MKKRKQIFKKICGFMCALVLFGSCFGPCRLYYANEYSFGNVVEFCNFVGVPLPSEFVFNSDNYYVVVGYPSGQFSSGVSIYEYNCRRPLCLYWHSQGYPLGFSARGGDINHGLNLKSYHFTFADGSWSFSNSQFSWDKHSTVSISVLGASLDFFDLPFFYSDLGLVYSSSDNTSVLNGNSFINKRVVSSENGFVFDDVDIAERYNSSLGYLQNVARKSTYIRDALYNYDEDSLTYHWSHDLTSTTGIDFSSGNYKIRHYISKATVKGYEREDIVEMSDKYLVAEYDAASGGFSYLKKDYDDKITALGYENIGWFDKYINGYFVLEHNYFQIVNTATNEVGGYLHFYPKDATGDSFGVELEYEGLDNDFEVDDSGPSGFIDNQTGSGLTHEDALENAEQPKLDDLGGVDEFADNLDAYASQIGGVTGAIGSVVNSLPSWFVGLLGLSVALSFAAIVFKVLRG